MSFILFLFLIWLLILSFKLDGYKSTINSLTKRIDILVKKLEKLNIKVLELESYKENLSQKEIQQEEYYKNDNNIEESLNNNQYEYEYEEEYEDEYEEQYEEQQDEYYIKKQNTYSYSNSKIKNDNSLENFFLGNAFTIVGAIALIIGVGIFIKIISEHIIFTPLMKTLLGFLFGTCLISTSNYINKKDNLKTYSEVLMGTGFSVLFITTLCTTVFFETFAPSVCAIIAGILLIVAYIVADKQKTISMIAISLIGGYLNIIFAYKIGIDMAFAYIIFLNLLSVVYAYRNPDKEAINVINLIVSLLFISMLMLFKGSVSVVYPIILWLTYLIFDLLKIYKNNSSKTTNSILNWINLGVLTVFSLIIFREEKLLIGATLFGITIVYNIIVALLVYINSDKFKPYLYSMLTTLLFSVYFLCSGNTKIMVWSLFSLITAIVVKTLKKEYLISWVLIFLAPAITNLFLLREIYFIENTYLPIWNERLLVFAFPIIGTLISHLCLKNIEDNAIQKISQLLKFIMISLIYLLCFLELNNFISQNDTLTGTIRFIPLVIVGFIYSLQMKKLSMTNNLELFNIAAYFIGALSLFTLGLIGINYSPIREYTPVVNTRVLGFIVAIGSSICFARWTKLDFFKYLATILGFILITCECFDCIDKFNNESINYIVSIVWLLYSGVITTIGIIKNKSYLKNVGIITSVLTVCRILFYDLSNLDAIYKLIIFISLGAIFMIVSYLYNKNKK